MLLANGGSKCYGFNSQEKEYRGNWCIDPQPFSKLKESDALRAYRLLYVGNRQATDYSRNTKVTFGLRTVTLCSPPDGVRPEPSHCLALVFLTMLFGLAGLASWKACSNGCVASFAPSRSIASSGLTHVARDWSIPTHFTKYLSLLPNTRELRIASIE
jgi:hypothetical protein